MKNIILDTDFGIDCDDAVALAMLINLQKSGKCNIAGITVSTTRRYAASAVRAVFGYYNASCPLIGKYSGKPLAADAKNVYAEALYEKYGYDDSSSDAVSVLRKILSEAKEKITISVIGPQSNISDLLLSSPDDKSPLSGVELVREKVDEIYVMGGTFDNSMSGEFNIDQDLYGAQNVCRLSPVPLIFISSEIASDILTGKDTLKEENNPVGLAVELLFKTEFPNVKKDEMERSSWDPMTTLLAVFGTENYASLSPFGKVCFIDSGAGTFVKGEGLHRIVVDCDKEKIRNTINELCVKEMKK